MNPDAIATKQNVAPIDTKKRRNQQRSPNLKKRVRFRSKNNIDQAADFSQYEGVICKTDISGTPLRKGMLGCILEPPEEIPAQEYIVETHDRGIKWWGYVRAGDLIASKDFEGLRSKQKRNELETKSSQDP